MSIHKIIPGLAAVLLSSAAMAAPRVHKGVQASPLVDRPVVFAGSATHTFETAGLSDGADTVMHLWDPATRQEVAWNDDGGAGLGSRIRYSSPYDQIHTFRLIVRASTSGTPGTADLLMDGVAIDRGALIGGSVLPVPSGAGSVYETAFVARGSRDPVLYGLDCDRRLIAFSDEDGVGLNGRIAGHANVCYAVVGAWTSGAAGPVDLYANDSSSDRDGDGLGAGLEAELGTCDNQTAAGCTEVFNPKDTDHDGLPDSAEVFGVDDATRPQHLPRWGASPRHKDVFVEVDYSDDFTSNPMQGSDAAAVQAHYTAGLAKDLQNPDDEGGVRLHLDLGTDPADAALATLYGNWGGSGAVPKDISYQDAPETYRTAVRAGLFHYGLATLGHGGGQGWKPGDRFGWGVQTGNRYPNSFAHELGHNVNLGHDGHEKWGAVNCKPHYRSLMNYAFGGVGFSQGESRAPLDPSRLSEAYALWGTDPSYLSGNPFNRATSGDNVDWNMDADYSGSGPAAIRGPATFASSVGCSALAQNAQELASDLGESTPALVRLDNRLYVFYVGADERLRYRQGLITIADAQGSCPGGQALGDTCMTWQAEQVVQTALKVRGVSASLSFGTLVLALRTELDSVRTMYANLIDAAGTVTDWSAEVYVGSHTSVEPTLSPMFVNPTPGSVARVLGLFVLDKASGKYRWYTQAQPQVAFASQGLVKDEAGAELSGTLSPAVVPWPSAGAAHLITGTACAVFPDPTGQARFFCLDRATGRFTNLTASAFGADAPPTLVAKPGLAYHVLRKADGDPLLGDPTRGQFWMSAVQSSQIPDVWISDRLSLARPPATSLRFPKAHRGKMGSAWTVLGSGAALYEDPGLSALKGVWVREADGVRKLHFLPLADGSFQATLKDGNDFQVMERGVCRGLADRAYCGTEDDSKWKL